MTLTSLRLYQVYGNSYSTTVKILLHLGPKRIILRIFITFRAKTVLHLGPLVHLGPKLYYI